MASEYRKTEAYRKGLDGKGIVDWTNFLRSPDRSEWKANEQGKRERAKIKAWKKRRD